MTGRLQIGNVGGREKKGPVKAEVKAEVEVEGKSHVEEDLEL